MLDVIRNKYYGKYRGIVMDNKDDTNRGRIKVQVQSVLGDMQVSADPCLPYTGKGSGSYLVPDKGAGVWVEFEAGNVDYPIWTGCYWADKELPKDEKSNTVKPSLRMIRSEKGLMLTMNDDSEIITLSDKDGSNIMTIEVNEGKIRIQGNLKVVVEAPMIELVENSTHPVVFGDNLLAYLNQLVTIFQAHTHPGELALGVLPVTPAPPVPVFPPATPSLLSTIVRTG
ncbi:phage baseplate assembly protein V [Hymenobacter volaticus]|uniref:Phage baseplate assembly protein V n=2 Tax=Hymenobacter volaticus TaxID=2932254 RepID=A0ABY4G212_9BACT|nr:phage baseplate assembly protein V [Hymenobacter volaticus]